MLKSVINAGIDHDLPDYLRKKVQPTNVIALLLLTVIAIPFSIVSLFYFPDMAVYPILGGFVCIIVLLINHFGGIYHSRIIISILPITLGAIYNAYLSGPGEPPLPALYLIELSFILIPFVIYDLREKGFLIITSIISATIIISFPVTREWLNTDSDSTVLREGWLSTVTIVLAIVGEIGCIYGLASINKNSERQSEKLLNEMEEKNKRMTESEKELKENLRLVEEAQENEQKRNWASEGIARISEIIRSNKNNEETFDKLIAEIVKYMKVNQGGLFVVQEKQEEGENEILINLVSCYAYDRKKYVGKSFIPGQGLIGQAYLEGDYIYMTEIPQNYVKITSGLGDANPTSILIMPLKVNDITEGIIELASFEMMEEYQISFLEKLGEAIASFIQNDRVNRQTKRLLEESIQSSEELKAQEEEMKQNMEELAATQEEMYRKEKEYQKQIEGLKNRLEKYESVNDILV